MTPLFLERGRSTRTATLVTSLPTSGMMMTSRSLGTMWTRSRTMSFVSPSIRVSRMRPMTMRLLVSRIFSRPFLERDLEEFDPEWYLAELDSTKSEKEEDLDLLFLSRWLFLPCPEQEMDVPPGVWRDPGFWTRPDRVPGNPDSRELDRTEKSNSRTRYPPPQNSGSHHLISCPVF